MSRSAGDETPQRRLDMWRVRDAVADGETRETTESLVYEDPDTPHGWSTMK